MNISPIFKNTRVVILIIALILSVIAISPHFGQEGVAIRSVNLDSAAYEGGISSPSKFSRPLDYEVIQFINGVEIKDESDYYELTNDLQANITVTIKTDQGIYTLTTKPKILLEETGNVIEKKVNITTLINGTNVTTTEIVLINETIEIVNGTEDIGLNIFNAASNNIRKGLDLSGGVRVLLKPIAEDNQTISKDVIERSISSLEQRLNAFGLNDVIIRESSDLSGNTFILVEIAGLQKKEISELIASQGKFEAKIANKTAFTGGEDVSYVCRSAECSGIDPNRGCGKSQDGYVCQFYFTIDMNPEAAQRQAAITGTLQVVNENGQQYLSEPIQLYLDDNLVDELNIGAGLRGRAETRIQISGSGVGQTREEAMTNTLENMKRLQTIIETGSLPVKLDIVKIDSLSPVLGDQFLKNALYTGFIAILAVIGIVFARYRSLKIAIPMMCATLSELLILLGVTALFGTNLDLAAIAGIIIVVGTSFDHQIVIVDELVKGEFEGAANWKQMIKNAFFIIMAAYFTTVVAMLPLWFAGAGILKGFALTTIYGISVGVFITRPAFAAVVKELLKE